MKHAWLLLLVAAACDDARRGPAELDAGARVTSTAPSLWWRVAARLITPPDARRLAPTLPVREAATPTPSALTPEPSR